MDLKKSLIIENLYNSKRSMNLYRKKVIGIVLNTIAKYGNCFQNNCPVIINSMLNECSAVYLTLQCFASDSSVWGGSPHKFSTQITCFLMVLSDTQGYTKSSV